MAARSPPTRLAAARAPGTNSSWCTGWLRQVDSAGGAGAAPTNGSPGSLSSAPAPVQVFQEDLELHVLGTDKLIIGPLMRKPEDIVGLANRGIRDSSAQLIRHRQVSYGRVLPSGDVILGVNSLEDAEQLTRASDWVKVFGERARLRKQTYGVVMHGVDVAFIESLKGTAGAVARIK